MRVLMVRKSCSSGGFWACDMALPGGRVEDGESYVEAALREAWEEAGIPPGMVNATGVACAESTRTGRVMAVVAARPRGPLEARPSSGEVDFAGWIPLDEFSREPEIVVHPRRGRVIGIELPGGLVVWGATLRLLRGIYRALEGLHQGTMEEPYNTRHELPSCNTPVMTVLLKAART